MRSWAKSWELLHTPIEFTQVEWVASHPFDCLVYVIGQGLSAVKIGVTQGYPERRLAQLQVGSAKRLYLVHCEPGNWETEQLSHLALAQHRLSGEWFNWRNANVARFIRRAKATGFISALEDVAVGGRIAA